MRYSTRSPQSHLMEQLVENAEMYREMGYKHSLKHGPGDAIIRLNSYNRSLLQELTAEDISNVRYPSYR